MKISYAPFEQRYALVSGSKSVQYTRCSIPQVSRFGRGERKIFGGPIEKANGFLFFPRTAPPDSTSLDTNDVRSAVGFENTFAA